jgi:hypothetical protein
LCKHHYRQQPLHKKKERATTAAYQLKNKEFLRIKRKSRYDSNPELFRSKSREWARKNPDKVKKTNKKSDKKKQQKKKNDPALRLRTNLSTSICQALKKQNSSKNGGSIVNHLPFTILELKTHLESLFEPWMNWNNYGKYNAKDWIDNDVSTHKWQLEHLIPQSLLPFTSMSDDNFKICWYLGNLRPYSAKQNLIDGNRREMKIKPKSAKINIPAAHLFDCEEEMVSFAAAINTVLFGTLKIKYDVLGKLGEKYVGLFYFQRNEEFHYLRDQFGKLIEQSEINLPIDEEDDQENIQPSEHHYLCDGCDEEILHSKELEHCGYCGGDWNHGKCEKQNQ